MIGTRALCWWMILASGLSARRNAGADEPSQRMSDFRLSPGVPILVDPTESAPILRAVEDLRRDLAKVFGQASPLIADASQLGARPAIVVTCRGAATASYRDPSLRERESHAMTARLDGGGPRVALQGADMRGTIYAVYSFSDRFLDVPPLWFWASWRPKQRASIDIPGGMNERFSPPHVAWRAWFPCDQDLIKPWLDADESRYDIILETMLRLKLNVIDLNDLCDFPSPSSSLRRARMARDRGLAVTTTHTSPFGAALGQWDKYWRVVRKQEPPQLSVRAPEKLEEFWSHYIRRAMQERFEMIWMIGFRGAGDVGFYEAVSDAPADDAARAKIVLEMMDRQVSLLKRVLGDARPTMRTVLYSECGDYAARGLLRPPSEPGLIWNFCSARRDHFPPPELRVCAPGPGQAVGYYLNLGFVSTGAHLAEAENPWKVERNYRMVEAAAKGPLAFSVVNVGNVREFVLTASANARMMWDFDGFRSDAFLKEFCARYWTPEYGERVAALYRDFFGSYWRQRKPDIPGFEDQYLFQDLRVRQAGRRLLQSLKPGDANPNPFDDRGMGYFRIAPEDNGAKTQLEAVLKGGEASVEKLRAVVSGCDALADSLPSQGRALFNDHLRTQARFMLEANQWLVAMARATEALPDTDQARQHLVEAQERAAAMWSVLEGAQHDDFKEWYTNDRFWDLKKIQADIAHQFSHLREPAAQPSAAEASKAASESGGE